MNLQDLISAGIKYADDLLDGKIPIIETGIKCLDDVIPITRGSINLFCARPGQGKTHLVQSILINIMQRHKVVYMSAEDNVQNTALRVIDHISRNKLKLSQIWKRNIPTDTWVEIQNNLKAVAKLDCASNCGFIFCNGWTLKQVLSKFEELEKRGCQVIIYDYLQLINTTTDELYQRHNQISEAMKNYFCNSKMTLLGVLQLNRAGDKSANPNSLPTLADLFGSSSYEKDAHSITMLQRVMKQENGVVIDTDKYYLLVKKNRLGGLVRNYVVNKFYQVEKTV